MTDVNLEPRSSNTERRLRGPHSKLDVAVPLAFALLAHAACLAADPTAAQVEFFENKIRPIFSTQCYKCHSSEATRVRGELFLDSRDGVLKGGESGPAIVPGDPGQSLLIKAVQYEDPDLQMPPKGKKLKDSQIAELVAWVKMGAPDPRVGEPGAVHDADAGKNHWAWQPLTHPDVPQVEAADWCQTDVDRFIMAKLEEKNLKPNPMADKRTLIRRATFDLTGLPPTPEEVDDFIADDSSDAFAQVVDRLLASPHYGERWGRHWLDVARYSDTKGEVRRQREDPNYPYAWTYRDYVIRSFNEDKPYNQFVVEQIAVDKVPGLSANPTNLTALGFLTVGERYLGMQQDIINDRIDVVTKGFLGLTVSCARCHDHKFDPIPQADYYSLHGIFASSREPRVEPVISRISRSPDYTDYQQKRSELAKEKAKLEQDFREARRKQDRNTIRMNRRQSVRLNRQIADLEMTHPGAPTRAMVLEDIPRPRNSPIFIRGETGNRGEVVPRRFLEVLSGPTRPEFKNGSGRLDLALAITSPSNPLTPRVMINRIWQHHFGEGFVPTPDDLGTMSEPPSHPELMDYLCDRFIEGGWSIKKIHRLIMLSSVYQQTTENHPRYARVDPRNRLLWRQNIRRLELEAIRDALLAISGKLDDTMYGRPVDLTSPSGRNRRTIYGKVDRSELPDLMVNFDFATPDMPNGRRHETTVPQQALFFMNNPMVVELAKSLVASERFRNLPDDETRVRHLYERIYQRWPRTEEVRLALDYVKQQNAMRDSASIRSESNDQLAENRRRGSGPARAQFRPFRDRGRFRGPEGRTPQPLTAWQSYAHALLQANEFTFVN